MTGKQHRWSIDETRVEALKFSTRWAFQKGSSRSYSAAKRNGWLDTVCAHMVEGKKPNGYWTKERCSEQAAKYASRRAFELGSISAYRASSNNDWHDEICAHMQPAGSAYKKFIYVISALNDNRVYVGVTANINRRIGQHRRVGSKAVRDLMSSPHEIVHSGVLLGLQALEVAEDMLMERLAAIGKTVLNKAKGGALGPGVLRWTKMACIAEAKKFATRGAFRSGNSTAYSAACSGGFLDEACAHMRLVRRKWNVASLRVEAKNFTTRTEFQKGMPGAYESAARMGILNEICSHMTLYGRAPMAQMNSTIGA